MTAIGCHSTIMIRHGVRSRTLSLSPGPQLSSVGPGPTRPDQDPGPTSTQFGKSTKTYILFMQLYSLSSYTLSPGPPGGPTRPGPTSSQAPNSDPSQTRSPPHIRAAAGIRVGGIVLITSRLRAYHYGHEPLRAASLVRATYHAEALRWRSSMRPNGAQVTVEVTLRRSQHLDGARFTSGPRYPTRGRRGTVMTSACACTGSRIRFRSRLARRLLLLYKMIPA